MVRQVQTLDMKTTTTMIASQNGLRFLNDTFVQHRYRSGTLVRHIRTLDTKKANSIIALQNGLWFLNDRFAQYRYRSRTVVENWENIGDGL